MDCTESPSAETSVTAVKDPEAANAEIVQAMEAGEGDEATRLIREALARWPNYTRLQLTQGEVFHKFAGAAQASNYYSTLLDERPAHPWALARLKAVLNGEALSAQDATQIADALFAAKLDGPERDSVFDALAKAVRPEERRAFLRTVAPHSKVFRLEWKLAVAETEAADAEAAIRILSSAYDEGRYNEAAISLLSELLAVCGRESEAVEVLCKEIARAPDRPDPYRKLVSLLQRIGAFKKAGEVMQEALERWPCDWLLLFRLNRLPVEPKRLTSIFHTIRTAADAEALRDERFRYHYALACLHAGELERARDLFSAPFAPPVDDLAAPVAKAFLSRPIDFWKRRSRLMDDRTLDVQITRSKGARLTVVLPTGIAFGFLPPAMIDALFAEHAINVIYLRDFRKRAYTSGVASLGRDEAETIGALKEIVASLGAPRIVTIGASMGGFAAFRYGALLDAYAALSFAGPTELHSVYDTAKSSVWNPSYFVKLQLQRESEMPVDLVPLLRRGGKTKFFQIFGEDAAEDAHQARRLKELDNVTLMPVRGVKDHLVIDHAIADGSFDAMLQLLQE
ncbi:MAG: hypothetical protein U1E20_04285 [Methylocystis sp.]|uniref:hypothetical protein n=1 Tax=Methylocystis sp. TaxID=1911079 RepID=UPI00395121AF